MREIGAPSINSKFQQVALALLPLHDGEFAPHQSRHALKLLIRKVVFEDYGKEDMRPAEKVAQLKNK